MAENYINIYSRFLSELGKTGQADLRRIYEMMEVFVPFLNTVRCREDLISFIDGQKQHFPELTILRQRLLDPTYVFPEPPEEKV